MKKSTTLFLTFFLIGFLNSVFCQELQLSDPESVGVSSVRLSFLTKTMNAYVQAGKLPGGVVLLARKGKVYYYEAFGSSDLENRQPMAKDAIFRIASQTKALVSVGTMMLQEEGKLNIHDPISKYIPVFKETTVAVPSDGRNFTIEKAKREITIRDLLTHTAGIGYGYGLAQEKWKEAEVQGWYFADREEPILKTIEQMASLPMDAHPGEKFVYGYNTDILGALIEIVSGQSLDTFFKERILNPLGMNDSHFYLPNEKSNRLATVYSYKEDKLEKAPKPGHMVGQGMYVSGPRKSFSGGAGLLSTAMDYAKFLQMMLNKGEFDGKRLVSRKTVELMTVNHLGNIAYPWDSGVGFGLGFATVEDLGKRGRMGSKGEFGWGGAYHSVYWVDPKEELVVVYFTQVIPADGLDDHEKLRNLVYQALED